MSDRTRGLAYGLAASLLWGSTYVVFRLLYEQSDLDPIGVTFARFLIGGATLAAAVAAQGRGRSLSALRRDPIPFLWLGLSGIAGMGVLVAVATLLTSADDVSLIMNSNPVLIALLAPLVGERWNAYRLAGALVGMAGVAVVVAGGAHSPGPAGAHDLWGALAALGAAFAWATFTLLGKQVSRRYGGLTTTTLAMLWGALLLAALLPAAHLPTRLPAGAILLLLYLGFLPSAAAFAFWYRALALVDASFLAPTQYLAPAATVVLAWIFLGERPGAVFYAGLALVSAGIALSSRSHNEGNH